MNPEKIFDGSVGLHTVGGIQPLYFIKMTRIRGLIIPAILLASWLGESAPAATITGYTAAANDRFSSGFPTSPVENTNPSFVGLGYDWSGVGWSTTTYSSHYKGLGTLSPVHFLTAQHFEYNAETTQGVRILGLDGMTHSATTKSISNLGQGLVLTNGGFTNYDLAIGRLNNPVTAPANMARHAVLDLHNTSASDSLSNYNGLPILLYGRSSMTNGSPRVGATTINLLAAFNSDAKQVAIRTTRNEVQLQGGDSASPTLHGWTNPNGGKELAILGTNSAIDTVNGYNYNSFLGSTAALAAANQVMNPDGYALRVVGNPTNTWVGSSSTSIANKGAWGLGPGPSQAPSDKFVTFNAATAGGNRQVTVDTDHNLRGLYFLSTAATDDGFTFSGSSTLTLGRGGVTNYDNSRQTIQVPLTLGDSQYWDGGTGGITAGAINTNGKLLEITGGGVNRITGAVSGTGALAISGGTLELTAANAYSGGTWVHSGTLVADNTTGSATGSGSLAVASGAVLAGSGIINSSTTISGVLAPGNSIGTLTINNDVTWHAGGGWLFELGLAADTLEDSGLGLSTQDRLVIGGGGSFLRGSGA
jgi:autotransporter-associated beta strand protein